MARIASVPRPRLSATGMLPGGRAASALALSAMLLCPCPVLAAVFGPPQVISATATSGRQIATFDVDQDGDLDVFGASFLGDRLAWYENDGTPGGLGDWVLHSLGAANLANSVCLAYIDNDAFIDVLAANSNSVAFDNIVWRKGDGTPLDGGWVRNTISNPGIGRRVIAADLDRDGDMDVVGGSANAEKLAWYENDGTPGGLGDWVVHEISSTLDIFTIVAVDMDRDGDLDILADTGGIRWWENDGTPGGLGDWVAHAVDAALVSSASVIAADVDRDGDPDVVAAEFQANKVVWYPNDNGAGHFAAGQVISTASTNAFSVFAVDVDRDGDLDVLSTSATPGAAVVWYENDGTPGGLGDWVQHVMDASATGASWVHAADLDGDTDSDALTMLVSGALVWYENLTITVDVPPARSGDALAIQALTPRAHGDGLVVTFTLPAAGTVRAQLIDVTGRRLQAIEWEDLEAGAHTLELFAGAHLDSGIYWLRLTQADRSAAARTAVTH